MIKILQQSVDKLVVSLMERRTIPRHVRRKLMKLPRSINHSTDTQEVGHTIELFRLMADPVAHGYKCGESNELIHLLNNRLANMGYESLQVREY